MWVSVGGDMHLWIYTCLPERARGTAKLERRQKRRDRNYN